MYKFSFCIFVNILFFTGMLNAQKQEKKPLNQRSYEIWNHIQEHSLSRDGKWVMFSTGPEEKDRELKIKHVSDKRMFRIKRGESAQFSADSRFSVFLIRALRDSTQQINLDKIKPTKVLKDSLGILALDSGKIDRIKQVISFKMPKNIDGWVAYHLEEHAENKDTLKSKAKGEELRNQKETEQINKPEKQTKIPRQKIIEKEEEAPKRNKNKGTELVLRNLQTNKESHYSDVTSYFFSNDGKWLIYVASNKDSTSDGIYAVRVKTGTVDPILTGPGDYTQVTLDEASKQVSFLSNRDDYLADQPSFTLYWWKIASDAPKALATEGTKGIPNGWWVSQHGKVSFSKMGKRLFFGTTPRPNPEFQEKKVLVELWNWKDPIIQSRKRKLFKKERERSFLAVIHLNRGRVVQLATEAIPQVKTGSYGDSDIAVGISDIPYQTLSSWDLTYNDIYLVEVSTGKHHRVLEKLSWGADLSPKSNYLTWWDRKKSSWFAMDVRSHRKVNLTIQIPTPVHNELHDLPYGPNDHGNAGWMKKEKAFIIYDKYDIWATDPTGNHAPFNITKGIGRANGLRLRYVQLNPDKKMIDPEEPVLISAFSLGTKAQGFYRTQFGKDNEPVQLTMMDRKFSDLQKAKDADVLLFRRSSFSEYPDLWISDLNFKTMKQISTANTQQSDYLWGTSELVEWSSLDGIPLQGLLFKPETFNPQKKYPLLIFFYEKFSEHLNKYHIPSLSRSSINFSVYTSQGYLVFVPDIFYKVGSPGEAAFNAILPGITSLIGKGFVDKKRIGLQGHSWGGYQVAYLITRTNLFKAAVAGAIVSNMISAYGGIRWKSGLSRMSQYERGQSRIGGSLWQYKTRFIENSPIFRADRIKTPLLMLHNENDGAVPWEEGIQMFMAMRRLGKPVWLINYSDEEHNLTKYQNRKDWTQRMHQFFDHYLKDTPAPVWMKGVVPEFQKGKTLGSKPGLQ